MSSVDAGIPFIKVYNLTFDGTLDFSIDPTFVDLETHEKFLKRSKPNAVAPKKRDSGFVNEAELTRYPIASPARTIAPQSCSHPLKMPAPTIARFPIVDRISLI
jgi:hypothetical protein